ncbi:plastid developmental protein DAG [Perilla frutescens var. frutescens]|nr:plastid developmental protein DAG [Perilla frutescens var. frutescens]
MAATIARSILTVRSTAAALLPKRLFSSTVFGPPPIAGFSRIRISTARSAVPALSHSIRVISPTRANPVRCRVNRSGSTYSPLNSGSNFNDRPPTEMAPLFPGCDYEHWLIVMDKPGGEGATKQQMIDCYVQTLARVVGSEEEAKRKMYNVSCERYFGFGCEIDEETSNKLEGLPGVLFVLPDSYVDAENKDYGAELFVNGEIVQRSPERQRRVEPQPQRAQDRPRYNDRTRYVRRRENMR